VEVGEQRQCRSRIAGPHHLCKRQRLTHASYSFSLRGLHSRIYIFEVCGWDTPNGFEGQRKKDKMG